MFRKVEFDELLHIGRALCRAADDDNAPTHKNVIWVDVANHTRADVDKIRLAFGVHPLTADDIVDECAVFCSKSETTKNRAETSSARRS